MQELSHGGTGGCHRHVCDLISHRTHTRSNKSNGLLDFMNIGLIRAGLMIRVTDAVQKWGLRLQS